MKKLVLLTAAVMLIATAPAGAADQPEKVDEVVVTAGRVEEKKRNVTFAFTVST